jgi:hypothetical protein
MPQRQDLQKEPTRLHARKNARRMARGFDVIPHTIWGDTSRGIAVPGSTFTGETTVTASDSTNAAKLAGLGYVASPTTNWTTGQAITVGGFAFNWTGSAWAAGTHA